MRGVIAAGSGPTAEAGAAIFRQGGNAVDAAVAAVFASFVAEAGVSSLGGGGFALLATPGHAPTLYDFFCVMPGLGYEQMPEDLDFAPVAVSFGDMVDTYYVGRGSTAVPGNPAGLTLLLREHGTLPLSVVIEPAVAMARDGVTISPAQADLIQTVGNIVQYGEHSARLFAPDGTLIPAGGVFKNPAFADALVMFGKTDGASFYEGELAQLLVEDHRTHGGLITQADLDAYRVIKREPLHLRYRGREVYTNPPPSAGGILIAYALRLLDQADLRGMQHNDADHLRLLAEIMRQANHTRRTAQPRHHIESVAWRAFLAGAVDDWPAVAMRWQSGPMVGNHDAGSGHPNTNHISAIDANGLTVAITTTPGATGGYTIGATGVLTNNILGERDLNPAGFHQWPVGQRLLSMMAPTIFTDVGNNSRVALGSAGSSRLRSAILQMISNLVDWSLPVEAAVEQERVHFENDLLDLEYGVDDAVADALHTQGYNLRRWGGQSVYFGGANVAIRTEEGNLTGAGDPRRDGGCVVVDA